MLKELHLRSVGPSAQFDVEFADRLNIFTGDNGLGKSFLLDVAWWVLSGNWVEQPAYPQRNTEQTPEIIYQINTQDGAKDYQSSFNFSEQKWLDYWSKFKSDLADGFNNLCGYSVMYEPVGSVDHFLSCENHRHLAYEWSNYRFISGWINSSKGTLDNQFLDPFEVEDDWFEILLPSLQLVMTTPIFT